jgi:hypothetical protein
MGRLRDFFSCRLMWQAFRKLPESSFDFSPNRLGEVFVLFLVVTGFP